jgi:hypothetical protein
VEALKRLLTLVAAAAGEVQTDRLFFCLGSTSGGDAVEGALGAPSQGLVFTGRAPTFTPAEFASAVGRKSPAQRFFMRRRSCGRPARAFLLRK